MSVIEDLGLWLQELEPAGGLTSAQTRVANTLAGNWQLASYSDLEGIAARAAVNASTVVRLAQALGFRGWPDFQREVRARYLEGLTSEETLGEHATDRKSAVHESVKHDIENLRTTMESIDPQEVDDLISVLVAAKRILVVGMGSFSAPATVFAHLGSTMGFPVTFEGRGGVHLATALHHFGPGDVLVLINMWRPMKDILAASTAARSRGATVVALTDLRKSQLAQEADHALIVPSEGVSFFQSVTAATSVIYGLLSGMGAADPDKTKEAIRRTQQLWQDLGPYAG